MQAIITRYLPATNFKGSRIKASCERGSLTMSYPHEINGIDNRHIAAAQALVNKFINEDLKFRNEPTERNPWAKTRVCGVLQNQDFVHVFVD